MSPISDPEYRKSIISMLAGALPEWRDGIIELAADGCLQEQELYPDRLFWTSVECSARPVESLPDGRLCMGVARDVDGEALLVQCFFEAGRITEVEWFKADLSDIGSLPPPSSFRAYATLTAETLELLPP